MGGANKVLKWFLGIFGSIFMLIGFTLVFFGLALNNMAANLDNFDELTATSVQNFIEENKEEVRDLLEQYMIQTMGPMDDILTKNTMKDLCQDPEFVLVEGEGVLAFQEMLAGDICIGIETKTDEQIKEEVFDALIVQQFDDILAMVHETEEMKATLSEFKEDIDKINTYLFGGAIFIYLLGIFLVFWSASFNWKKGLYSVSLQTAIKLLTVALVFIYVNSLKPDTIYGYLNSLQSHFPELAAAAAEAPPLLFKMGAAIMLEWIRVATNPLIIISFIAMIPFVAIVVVLLIVRHKERKHKNPKALKEEVI